MILDLLPSPRLSLVCGLPQGQHISFREKTSKKHDLGFIEHLALSKLEARTSNKKRQHDGIKKKGKRKVLNSNFEIENSRVSEHHDNKHREDTLSSKLLMDVQMRQLDIFPSGKG
jgi:hypothetical protein